ncbi:MAG: LysM peptidoglycan-binding domain-containing protein [Bacteroidia bacterium]|nr:LysM peptidoglycan-binding domain-containing protein [Bacteroidia bacterium]
MIKKILSILFITLSFFINAYAQKLTPEQYVEKYKDIAIREMKRMGVPAAVTLAQGLLETENGNSDLVKKSNNHFGIKCKSSWTAGGVTHDDDAIGECFRSYKDANESYRDHSNYLRGSDRYASLFTLQPTDYKAWAKGLRKAGYATNPRYPEILIRNIEQYNLQQYSLAAVGDMPVIETSKYEDDKEPVVKKTDKIEQQSASNGEVAETQAINKLQYIIGKKGVSLLAIATENDINLNKLLSYNDLSEDGILKNDQIIFLQKKAKKGDKDFYIVQQNETLHDVAQRNGIQLKYLLEYNQLTEKAIPAQGLKLYLSPTAETQLVKAIQNNAKEVLPVFSKTKTHAVLPKEGLYFIARKYQVSVKQLREWNNLNTDELKIGQQLIVSN